jgi:transcriptional regulator with XRE-family HTH domain
LRGYRVDQGLAVEGAASILGCDPSKIGRIENGVRGIRATELNELLTEYGVSEPERAALAAIARPLAAGGWWHGHSDVLTRNDREYFQLEAIADRIDVYQPQLVPALLQTAAYAEAVGGLRRAVRSRR